MSSTYGTRFRFTIFGQSHSPAIGVTIEGLSAGSKIDINELQAFLGRRAPGRSDTATERTEQDKIRFLCGIQNGVTCGTPLTAIIENTDIRPDDYVPYRDCPRPGTADYAAAARYHGFQDASGGGHFSGRLTAPLCIAGGIAMQLLAQMGITVGAHIASVADVQDDLFEAPTASMLKQLKAMELPTLRTGADEEMRQAILHAKSQGDSVGGVIECAAVGVPAGWGDPMFGGMENRIAQIIFAIPAVRGLEFGTGFAAAQMRGSTHNDAFTVQNGKIVTETNHHGGILGGITTAMPVIFRFAVKPTPSIAIEQKTVQLSTMEPCTVQVQGRHDPCIVPRAVPVAEAALAAALYDAYLCTL